MHCDGKTVTPTARERELFRYWQPAEDVPNATTDTAKVSSSDPILTSFAQLGALRTNTRRCMITLITREDEYIIAEASQTLSLQRDNDEQDPLWHGVATVRSKGLGHDMVNLFCDPKTPQYRVYTDVTKVDMFKDRRFVKEAPFVRFIACVPLRSSGGMVIGVYMVVSDQIREDLNESELQFMKDMSVTVMDYLEAGRVKQKQYRAERMVKAMGLFIEGRASLREWWLQGGHSSEHATVRKRTRVDLPLEERADLEFGIQDPVDVFTAKGLDGLHPSDTRPTLVRSLSSSTLSQRDSKTDARPVLQQQQSVLSTTSSSTMVSRSWHERNSSMTTVEAADPIAETEERHHSVAFDLPPENVGPGASKEFQDALLSSDLKGVFARASNLICEAISVEGVLFLDASTESLGTSTDKERAPGAFNAERPTSSDDDQNGRGPSQTRISGDAYPAGTAQEPGCSNEKYCKILGFSTRRRSSLRGHAPYESHEKFSESVMRRLLKKYPHGRVFNFEEDGSYSDSDHAVNGFSDTDGLPQKPEAHETKAKRKRLSREAEAKAILTMLPKARSVFWFPLWDQGKERWFSGSLVWSTTPTRTFCPTEDLTYLAAFGNSVMSEVSRLSAQVLAQMKSDFISSISHELRSPLHGVLASVEFLQETKLDGDQIEMVYNIQASAKVLLDTLNHVLDFSKVNRKLKNKESSPAFRSKRSKKVSKRFDSERQSLDYTADDIADANILTHEVVESVFAGRKINKRAFNSGYRLNGENLHSMVLESPVTVIIDVIYSPSWRFEMDSGAWRRILMNLFNNSMKYTETGFVHVSLSIESDTLSRSKKSRSILTLKVKDSGKGISQEFLKHRMFKPFTQEDSLAAGAGLGLSIVRHIVHDLGGEINFVSEQGVGTEATVRIPLTSIPASKTVEQKQLTETRSQTNGLIFSLEGFDKYPDITETPTGILSSETEAAMLLKNSVRNLMIDWFRMEPASSSIAKYNADVVVMMEPVVGGSVSETLQTYHSSPSPAAAKSIAIVFSDNHHSGHKIHSHGRFKVFYIPQPYGPYKITKLLHSAFCKTFSDSPQHKGTILQPHIQTQVLPLDIPPPVSIEASTSSHTPTRRYSLQSASQPDIASAHQTTTLVQGLDHESHAENVPPANCEQQPGEENKAPGIPTVKSTSGMRVLLVEDNEINLKLLVAYMRKLKLDHATACNGLEALNTYKKAHDETTHFDVIFMDISMPIMSGIESTQHIRRFEREMGLEPVALIALTGAANPNTRQEAFSSGVDVFLTKPVPMKSLKVMLDELKTNGRAGMGA